MTVKSAVEGFSFGCDPEVFILNKEGEHVSAANLIPGSKVAPHPVPCGAIHPDGMAAEFGINPAKSFAEFNRNIETVMEALRTFLPEGYTIDVTPSVKFKKELFDAAPDDAKELGCVPDMDAYSGNLNPPPSLPNSPYLRCAGGHLHIGWGTGFDIADADHVLNCREFAQQLDWHLGAWSLRLDTDRVRRRLYGKAGAIRVKEYGVEYRTLSNFWIISRERRLSVWNRLQNAIMDMQQNFLPETYSSHVDAIVDAINTSSRSLVLERAFKYPLVIEDQNRW